MQTRTGRVVLWSCIAAIAFAANSVRAAEADEAIAQRDVIVPREVIQLFNGRDLTGLYSWLKKTQREDPQHVVTVRDGALHLSGDDMGYVATDKAYRDYRLVVEYKWGERTFGSKYVRNSGILLHGTGPDGSSGGVWMNSIEVQLAQGCVGDFIVIRGKDASSQARPATITCETVLASDRRTRWQRGGQKTVYSGKQFWWSQHDPEFKELIDTRGRNDVDSPLGEWTRMECVCAGDRITISVNGTVVNECFDAVPSAGKILLQTEGFDVLFRKFELHPLPDKR